MLLLFLNEPQKNVKHIYIFLFLNKRIKDFLVIIGCNAKYIYIFLGLFYMFFIISILSWIPLSVSNTKHLNLRGSMQASWYREIALQTKILPAFLHDHTQVTVVHKHQVVANCFNISTKPQYVGCWEFPHVSLIVLTSYTTYTPSKSVTEISFGRYLPSIIFISLSSQIQRNIHLTGITNSDQ